MQVEAQEGLLDIQVVSFPHMKKEGQNKTHRRMHALANPRELKRITMEELREQLLGG